LGDTYSSPSGSGSSSSNSYSSPSIISSDSGSISAPSSTSSDPASDSYGTPVAAPSSTYSNPPVAVQSSDAYVAATGAVLDASSLESGPASVTSSAGDDYGTPVGDIIGNGPFDSPFEPSPRINPSEIPASHPADSYSSSPSAASSSYLGPSTAVQVASPPDPIVIDITGASNTYASPDNDLASVVDLRTPTGPSSPASDDYGLPNAPPLGLPSYSSNRRISNVKRRRRWQY